MREKDCNTFSAIKELGAVKLENLKGSCEPDLNYDPKQDSEVWLPGRFSLRKKNPAEADTG